MSGARCGGADAINENPIHPRERRNLAGWVWHPAEPRDRTRREVLTKSQSPATRRKPKPSSTIPSPTTTPNATSKSSRSRDRHKTRVQKTKDKIPPVHAQQFQRRSMSVEARDPCEALFVFCLQVFCLLPPPTSTPPSSTPSRVGRGRRAAPTCRQRRERRLKIKWISPGILTAAPVLLVPPPPLQTARFMRALGRDLIGCGGVSMTVALQSAPRSRKKSCLKRPTQGVLFPRCQMNQSPSQSQSQRTQSYLSRIRIERSRKPSLTTDQFCLQMERSMGTKIRLITPNNSERLKLNPGFLRSLTASQCG